MCQLEWAPLYQNTGKEKRGPTKKDRSERRGEMTFKSHSAQEIKVGRAVFNQVLTLVPPFTEWQNLWKIRTPTYLKKSISWCLAQKGNPYIPSPCADQLLSFKSAYWCLRIWCALGPSRCSFWVILTESLSPQEVVKGSDGKHCLTSGTELAGNEIIMCAWERWPMKLLRLCSSSIKPRVATWVFL